MRFWGKLAAAGTVGIGIAAYRSRGDKAEFVMEAAPYNERQDQIFLASALKDLEHQNVALYKLRSCPYCSMVGAFLDYANVNYHEVLIDPLTMKGLPKTKYALVPQLQFFYDRRRKADPVYDENPEKLGPFLVDSELIIDRLAEPLGMSKQLADPRVIRDRKWIRDRFTRSAFLAMNGTYAHAYSSYPSLVPDRYQNPFCRVVGAIVLSTIAKRKVYPRVLDYLKQEEAEKATSPISAAPALTSSSNGDSGDQVAPSAAENAAIQALTAKPMTVQVESLLRTAADDFVYKLLPKGAKFHGGETPDIVDIELYGVYRSTCLQSTPARLALERSVIGPWADRMKKHVPLRKHPALTP